MNVVKYAMLYVMIDGHLQAEQTGAVVSTLIEDGDVVNRVELLSMVRKQGLEFDGRLLVGTDHEFRVHVASAAFGDWPRQEKETPADWMARHPTVCDAPMKLVAFEVRQKSEKHAASARAVFENRTSRVRDLTVVDEQGGHEHAVALVDAKTGDRYRVRGLMRAPAPE